LIVFISAKAEKYVVHFSYLAIILKDCFCFQMFMIKADIVLFGVLFSLCIYKNI